MAYHELFVLNSDPHYCHLWAAVGIERGQMSERSSFDHFACRLRNLHGCLSFNAAARPPSSRIASIGTCSRACHPTIESAHRPEGLAEIFGQSLRLLPSGEMRALRVTLVKDQVRIGFARPAFRRLVNLLSECADTGRKREPLWSKEGQLALPVQPRRR